MGFSSKRGQADEMRKLARLFDFVGLEQKARELELMASHVTETDLEIHEDTHQATFEQDPFLETLVIISERLQGNSE